MEKEKTTTDIKTGTLAFIGDAVYELFVRKMLVESGEHDPEKLHIEKKARNHKMANRSRSAGMVDYKLATGLEALVGSLYMNGNEARLLEVVGEAIRVVKSKSEK